MGSQRVKHDWATELDWVMISKALPWFLQVFYLPLPFGSFANFLFITGFSSLWFALFFPSVSCLKMKKTLFFPVLFFWVGKSCFFLLCVFSLWVSFNLHRKHFWHFWIPEAGCLKSIFSYLYLTWSPTTYLPYC